MSEWQDLHCFPYTKTARSTEKKLWMTLLPAVIADLISYFSIHKICERNYFTKAKDLKWILYDKQLLCPWPYIGRTNTWETIHINCPPVPSCYRYDSVRRDGLLVRESEGCHVLSWPNKHVWVAPRASWRASVPVYSLISKFLRRYLSAPCTIICKVSDMSAKLCLLPLPRIC